MAANTPTLKAPFPAFGGKSRIAAEVWARFGDVRNYIEPFCFSTAVLLKRPGGAGAIETINDRNAFVANFWRAVRSDPEAVAAHADWPVNETDLHARHRWLVGSDEAAACLNRVREDPDAFDARIAGWWCWGACCWIGSGWCDETPHRNMGKQRVFLTSDGMGNGVARDPAPHKLPPLDAAGRGVQGSVPPEQLPHLDAAPSDSSGRRNMPFIADPSRGITGTPGEQMPTLAGEAGAHGRGVNASAGHNRCKLSGNGVGNGVHSNPAESGGVAGGGEPPAQRPNDRQPALAQPGWGINAIGDARHEKRPVISADGSEWGRGVHGQPSEESRPQLADQFARGRGVNGRDDLGACGARREWITGWMMALADRLRPVRVCCGHWSRVCDSPSTMTRLGLTGVFLDPPYRVSLACGKKNRTAHIYANDRVQDVNALCDEVEAWCLKWGADRDVRIALCGLEGEYPGIERAGWEAHAWKSNGGYGNQGGGGAKNENAARERVWFSPHCVREGHGGLFT